MLGVSPFGHCWLTNGYRERHRGAPKRGKNGRALNLIPSVEKHVIRKKERTGREREETGSSLCQQ